MKNNDQWWSGWWFGCHFLFSHILGIIIIPIIDFQVFQRGGPTTNQWLSGTPSAGHWDQRLSAWNHGGWRCGLLVGLLEGGTFPGNIWGYLGVCWDYPLAMENPWKNPNANDVWRGTNPFIAGIVYCCGWLPEGISVYGIWMCLKTGCTPKLSNFDRVNNDW